MEINPETCLAIHRDLNDKSAADILNKLNDCVALGENYLRENGANGFLDDLATVVKQASQIFFSRTLLTGEPFHRLKRGYNELLFRMGYRDRDVNQLMRTNKPEPDLQTVHKREIAEDFSPELWIYLGIFLAVLVFTLIFGLRAFSLIYDIRRRKKEALCCFQQSNIDHCAYHCYVKHTNPKMLQALYKGIVRKIVKKQIKVPPSGSK